MLNPFGIIATCAPSPKGEIKGLNHNVKGTLLKNTCETIHIYSIVTWNLILIIHFNYYEFTDVHKENSVIYML
jgi:hypothetical protein